LLIKHFLSTRLVKIEVLPENFKMRKGPCPKGFGKRWSKVLRKLAINERLNRLK